MNKIKKDFKVILAFLILLALFTLLCIALGWVFPIVAASVGALFWAIITLADRFA